MLLYASLTLGSPELLNIYALAILARLNFARIKKYSFVIRLIINLKFLITQLETQLVAKKTQKKLSFPAVEKFIIKVKQSYFNEIQNRDVLL